ncbi:hypothetical protein HG537_0A07470 [Torulaspora globosa]|uniref:Uncharacterized protein n=1 Tax=Torulaspora globosa TaxID=48254 RepID=A0A7H9HME3_9SACH|nr:hypothetical protein HG537_0A07470 [Torulaspora sp. CBS 2947]
MTKSDREVIYLYARDDHPKVKLTREEEFTGVQDLVEYFHSIQDTFYVEFETSETITENLKLRCISYGGDEFDGSVPFFILEYDEILDTFYVWKSEGQWQLNKLISTLYTDHSLKGSHKFVERVKDSSLFKKHPRKELIDCVLDKLNVDWSQIDIDQFWIQLDNIIKLNENAEQNELSFKSLVSMAVLKTRVMENKSHLDRAIKQYHKRMRIEDTQNQKSPEIKRDASPTSSLSPSPTYTHENENDQVVTNFNRHFKLMAEDYETFDLKSWAAFPQRTKRGKTTRKSQPKNCISKVKS